MPIRRIKFLLFALQRITKFRGSILLCTLVGLVLLTGCYAIDMRWKKIKPPKGSRARVVQLETTGYCDCGSCCGWERNWLFQPVYAYGSQKGKRKKVGITASGRPTLSGTIAADTRRFPFGTVMYIPGYGYGVVEDRGGNIKGNRVDLFFPSHQKALEWGRRSVRAKVWIP